LAAEIVALADDLPPRSFEDLLAMILHHLADGSHDDVTVAIYGDLLRKRPSSQIADSFGISESTVSRHRTCLKELCHTVLETPSPPKKRRPPVEKRGTCRVVVIEAGI
jgi:hypothetical protein